MLSNHFPAFRYEDFRLFWFSDFIAQLISAPAAVVVEGLGALGIVASMAFFNPDLRNHTHETLSIADSAY